MEEAGTGDWMGVKVRVVVGAGMSIVAVVVATVASSGVGAFGTRLAADGGTRTVAAVATTAGRMAWAPEDDVEFLAVGDGGMRAATGVARVAGSSSMELGGESVDLDVSVTVVAEVPVVRA